MCTHCFLFVVVCMNYSLVGVILLLSFVFWFYFVQCFYVILLFFTNNLEMCMALKYLLQLLLFLSIAAFKFPGSIVFVAFLFIIFITQSSTNSQHFAIFIILSWEILIHVFITGYSILGL